MSDAAAVSPYTGLRVVDASRRVSGAFAARLFGDFGADVILAEPPAGHPLRHEPPFLAGRPGVERSAVHAYLNWNKRSSVVATAGDAAAVLAGADVVVTDGAWEEQARAAKVVLSITPYGSASPLTGQPGNELTAAAASGWCSINGFRGEQPLRMPGFQAGYLAGAAGFVAAAAALRRVAAEGPQQVSVSELEAMALSVHPWGVAAAYQGGEQAGRDDRRPLRGVPGPLYEAADGPLSMAVAYFRHWPEAMAALGVPELGTAEDLIPDGTRHTRDLTAVIDGIVASLRRLQRWPTFHKLASLRCPVGVVQDVASLLADEQLASRKFFVGARIDGHVVRAPGGMARCQPALWHLARPAPRLGEGTPPPVTPPPEPSAVPSPIAPAPASPAPASPAAESSAAGSPLTGLRVLSFGQAWSGAFATELLALLGADVVQIGSLTRHDSWRRAGAPVPAAIADPDRAQHPLNTQGLYNSVNLNKRELAIDLETASGQALLWRLLPRFDVVVDNFRPGVMARWGVTLGRLHELHPGMIWASLSGYGASGPYGSYPAIGTTIEPMAGLSSLHGYDGEQGRNTGGLYPDPVAGYLLAAFVIAALAARDRTGQPQRIDLSMLEAVAAFCGDAVVGFGADGRLPAPIGNHHPRVAPHNVYAAAGGEWLALACDDDDAWAALRAHVGDPALRQPAFATMAARKAHEAELDAVLAGWCADRRAGETAAALRALGVAAAPVVALGQLWARPDPALVASGFVSSVGHPQVGHSWLPGAPWTVNGQRPALTAAPCVGQHSAEILTAELGIGEDEYRSLVAAGITGTLEGAENTGGQAPASVSR
jgi:crotonobetainyl-CoA:carnitine CoA-transferase CaiB-like acyl-CoA transferase